MDMANAALGKVHPHQASENGTCANRATSVSMTVAIKAARPSRISGPGPNPWVRFASAMAPTAGGAIRIASAGRIRSGMAGPVRMRPRIRGWIMAQSRPPMPNRIQHRVS